MIDILQGVHEEERQQLDDDGIDLNRPLDLRFVVVGLMMMTLSLPMAIFLFENSWVRVFLFMCFVASFFIVGGKQKSQE